MPSFKRICAEFGIFTERDFRSKESDNYGLRTVFISPSYVGPEADHSTTCPGRKKFSDERGKAIKGCYFVFMDITFIDILFFFVCVIHVSSLP